MTKTVTIGEGLAKGVNVYVVRQGDASTHRISHKDLEAQYLGFCWFIKPKLTADHRSELPEYHLQKPGSGRLLVALKNITTKSF